jgi:hypothetical protein
MECLSSSKTHFVVAFFPFLFFCSCCASRAILRCSVTLSCVSGLELENARQTVSACKSHNTWETKCTPMFSLVVQCLLRQSFVCVVRHLVARGGLLCSASCNSICSEMSFCYIGRFMAPSRLGDFPRPRWDRAANNRLGPGSWSVRIISRPSARLFGRTTCGRQIALLRLLDVVGVQDAVQTGFRQRDKATGNTEISLLLHPGESFVHHLSILLSSI